MIIEFNPRIYEQGHADVAGGYLAPQCLDSLVPYSNLLVGFFCYTPSTKDSFGTPLSLRGERKVKKKAGCIRTQKKAEISNRKRQSTNKMLFRIERSVDLN